MEEPGGQVQQILDGEHVLTGRVIKEVSKGKYYNIDLSKLDEKSVIDLRRLIRDIDDRHHPVRNKKLS